MYKYNPLLKYGFEKEQDSIANVSFPVSQSGHGFSVLDSIYWNHTNNQWEKAVANSILTMGTHLVVASSSIDSFIAGQIGRFYIPLHGLTGEYYFTSDMFPGTLTETEPLLSNPLLKTEGANYIHLLSYRPFKKLVQLADFVFQSSGLSSGNTITHNLGKIPYITFTDLFGNVIDLGLTYNDVNTVTTTATPSVDYVAYFIVTDKYFTYDSAGPVASSGIINHNFGRPPLVTVTDQFGDLIVSQVTHIDNNNIQVDVTPNEHIIVALN